MKAHIITLIFLGYVIAGVIVVLLYARKRLAPHICDMFDMLLLISPIVLVLLGPIIWPLFIILGVAGNRLSLKTSLKPGDGNEKPNNGLQATAHKLP